MPNQNFNEDLREYANAALAGTLPAQSTTLPANQSVNVSQVNGSNAATNSGSPSSGTQRVVLATGATPSLAEFAFGASLAASQTLLASSLSRQATVIANDTDVAFFIRFGAVAATITSYSVKIPPGGIYECPRALASTEIRGIGASAGTTGAVHVTSVI